MGGASGCGPRHLFPCFAVWWTARPEIVRGSGGCSWSCSSNAAAQLKTTASRCLLVGVPPLTWHILYILYIYDMWVSPAPQVNTLESSVRFCCTSKSSNNRQTECLKGSDYCTRPAQEISIRRTFSSVFQTFWHWSCLCETNLPLRRWAASAEHQVFQSSSPCTQQSLKSDWTRSSFWVFLSCSAKGLWAKPPHPPAFLNEGRVKTDALAKIRTY